MTIGLLSDSKGDLGALDKALRLLAQRGAKRFFFLGSRYADFDEVLAQRREEERGGKQYDTQEFLTDVASFVATGASAGKPPASKSAADELARRTVRVPEKDSLQYRDPNVQPKMLEMIDGVIACLVHDKADLDRDDIANATLLIHGKSSAPAVVQVGPRFFITPGPLAGVLDPTCAMIEPQKGGMLFTAFTLDGHEGKKVLLTFSRGTKFSSR